MELPERYVAKLRQQLVQNPMGFGHLALAADALLDGASGVTFAGTRDAVAPLLAAASRVYAPTVAFGWKEPGAPVPPPLKEIFEGREPVGGSAAAYLCRGFVCEQPMTDPQELAGRLQPSRPG